MELLVASSILLILMGLAVQALQAAQSRKARVDTQLALDSDATIGLTHIVNDVSETSANVIYAPTDQLLVLPLARDIGGVFTVANDGQLNWGTLVAFRAVRVHGESQLLRQVEDVTDSLGTPHEASAMTPLPDALWWNSRSGPQRKICEGFISLTVTKLNTKTVELSLHLRKSAKGRTYGIKLETQVTPRN